MGPIHFRGVMADEFSMGAWRSAWTTGEAVAKAMDLTQSKGCDRQAACDVDSCSDADLRTKFEMFGSKASRGSWIVNLVLSHYAAYRMQLFLYLKACGREELNTMNLWVGMDRA
jgi:hypothetical protein